jgi:hypothetical protein
MSYFQTLKASITCRDAAESYGLEVSRSGMARCPFHEDHTPSLKLDDRYYCFGCHAQGDVIDFTARLLGISNYSAAKQLGQDFGIQPRPATEEKTCKTKPPLSTESLCLSVLMEYFRLLRFWSWRYAPEVPGKPFHEKFVEACHRSSFITHLIDEMMGADPWRRKQVMDILKEDDRIHRLQEYVLKKKMEETEFEK